MRFDFRTNTHLPSSSQQTKPREHQDNLNVPPFGPPVDNGQSQLEKGLESDISAEFKNLNGWGPRRDDNSGQLVNETVYKLHSYIHMKLPATARLQSL